MTVQPSVLQVVILRDGLLVGTEVFVPGSYTLGSSPGVDLLLDDPQVAPQQATLYFQNGLAAIQDTGGGRGVYVNGHPIRACKLRSVDEVACGPFVLKARVLQQQQQQRALPPEVAHLLRATPAAGSPSAGAFHPAAPHAQAPIPLRAAAGTAPSARRLAEPKPPARPSAPPPPPASFQEEHPTYRNGVPAAGPLEPASGEFMAARSLSADGDLVSHDAPDDGAAASLDLQLEPSPEPIRDSNGIPTGSVVNFQWPSAPPEMEESRPAYTPDEPLQARPRIVPPVPPLAAKPPVPSVAKPSVAPVAKQAAVPVAAPVAKQAPVAKPAVAPRAAPAAVKSAQKLPRPKKGGPRLYLELYWAKERHKAWSFVPTVKRPVVAGPREDVAVPIYGLGLEQKFVLGEQGEKGAYKLFVPPGVKIERGQVGASLSAVAATALETDDTRRFVTLESGTAVRLSAGETSLLAWVAAPPAKEKVSLFRRLPLLLLVCLLAITSGAVRFLYEARSLTGETGFTPRDLPSVAVRLIAPTPKKKERVKKNLAEMQARASERSAKKEPAKPAGVPKPKTPQKETVASQSKALQAIKKLTSGGATGDILSAMSKNPGGGSPKAKGYALAGLIGKGPAVPGTGGLGSGGLGKGRGTLGSELLRGAGGTGIGAIGAGGVGKGTVGGTVARATGRTVQSSGDIDRNAVAKVVNDNMGQVQACYERALLRTPSLAGKVVIEWSIGGQGKVASVRTKSSTLRSSEVEGCIMNALKKWQFPKPRGGSVIITYPFLFNSVGF